MFKSRWRTQAADYLLKDLQIFIRGCKLLHALTSSRTSITPLHTHTHTHTHTQAFLKCAKLNKHKTLNVLSNIPKYNQENLDRFAHFRGNFVLNTDFFLQPFIKRTYIFLEIKTNYQKYTKHPNYTKILKY